MGVTMPAVTYDDIRRFRRCPYAFRLDRTEAFPDKLTLPECLETAVKDTIGQFSEARILGNRMKDDRALEMFWDCWDKSVSKLYNPLRDDTGKYVRIGEKCIRNFLYQATRFGSADIVASDMEGTLELPGRNEISIRIDEVGRKGTTAYITKYITDLQMMSKEQLTTDLEMRLNALWAMDNLGSREVVMRWCFLVPSVVTDVTASRGSCAQAADEVSALIEQMSAKDVLPRETDYCRTCPYQSRCPRFLHEILLREGGPDEGSALADRYLELEEKKTALKRRIDLLEAEQDALRARIVSFSDEKGYMSVACDRGKLLVRHERKAELPQDKTAVIRRLKETGDYDRISMPNYSRLRSDIVKGIADPVIISMANISKVDKIYIKPKE